MKHAALTLLAIIILSALQGCGPEAKPVDYAKEEQRIHDSIENQMVVTPGKKPLRLLTERPYNLETPLKYFQLDLTPNDVFFIRWHLPTPPEAVSEDTFRLRIHGNTSRPLALSMHDLRTKFTPYKMVAVCACSGNARSLFKPGVPGAQWVNGGMGNAEWTGVKLKDILAMAGARPGSKFVSFNGLDQPVFPSTPDFVKSLEYSHAIGGEVMVAYEMNGEPLPLLNGYPLKLVVPGWYATYWVKMLSDITVHRDSFKGFWMDKAYLVPRNSRNGNEQPKALAKDMVPINKLDVRSIFVSPDSGTILRPGRTYELQGLAMDDGTGIVKVEISNNKGKTWTEAKLDPSLGKYSWRRWRYNFTPSVVGPVEFVVKATNAAGDTQPWHQWNRSGYMRNEIESLTLTVAK
ncbi:molybdopterin-dependent oxidoreductase [Polluticoccus soli]|uniref:molybdopterin-dependent oxidoreductase n=1 Tax=Polluticoccus soli TaxID=3034150 RepID=UPI0023E2E810|nr:molybdopterin-dependent oxidoreductase [Flavipsychrobacter sp. JY13-12]